MASRPVRAPRAPADDGEGGFAIVELLVGVGIFALLAIGFAGTMASSLTAQLHSRQRATANQLATEQVERARSLAYDDVGTIGGNPAGLLEPTKDVAVGASTYRVDTSVALVADAVATAFATQADYKQLVVTVTRPGSSTSLARLRTIVAPPTQPSLTKAVVEVQVLDATNGAVVVPGVTVQLSGGSGGTRSGITDGAGHVVFPALPPTTGAQTYQATATSLPTGWRMIPSQQIAADLAGPALATEHKVLKLRLSRQLPATVTLKDANGVAFVPAAGKPANVTVLSVDGMSSYPVTTGSLTLQLWSGVTYSIAADAGATATTAWFAPPASLTPDTSVPASTSTSLTMVNRLTAPLTIKTGVASLAVRVRNGPNGLLLTGTTAATGNLVLNVPSGNTIAYLVEIDAQSGWAAASGSVAVGSSGATTTFSLVRAP